MSQMKKIADGMSDMYQKAGMPLTDDQEIMLNKWLMLFNNISATLTDHVNAEKVKMLEDARERCFELPAAKDNVVDCCDVLLAMIKELTKPTGEE